MQKHETSECSSVWRPSGAAGGARQRSGAEGSIVTQVAWRCKENSERVEDTVRCWSSKCTEMEEWVGVGAAAVERRRRAAGRRGRRREQQRRVAIVPWCLLADTGASSAREMSSVKQGFASVWKNRGLLPPLLASSTGVEARPSTRRVRGGEREGRASEGRQLRGPIREASSDSKCAMRMRNERVASREASARAEGEDDRRRREAAWLRRAVEVSRSRFVVSRRCKCSKWEEELECPSVPWLRVWAAWTAAVGAEARIGRSMRRLWPGSASRSSGARVEWVVVRNVASLSALRRRRVLVAHSCGIWSCSCASQCRPRRRGRCRRGAAGVSSGRRRCGEWRSGVRGEERAWSVEWVRGVLERGAASAAAEGGCCAERRSLLLESESQRRLRGAAGARSSGAVSSMLCSVCARVVACSCVCAAVFAGGRESGSRGEASLLLRLLHVRHGCVRPPVTGVNRSVASRCRVRRREEEKRDSEAEEERSGEGRSGGAVCGGVAWLFSGCAVRRVKRTWRGGSTERVEWVECSALRCQTERRGGLRPKRARCGDGGSGRVDRSTARQREGEGRENSRAAVISE